MNVRAARRRLRVAEVPSYEAKRIYGESHLSAVRDGLRILRTIVGERLRPRKEVRTERPIAAWSVRK